MHRFLVLIQPVLIITNILAFITLKFDAQVDEIDVVHQTIHPNIKLHLQ